MDRSFIRTTLYINAGLLIWTGNFLVTYVFAALACARGFADRSIFGLGVIALVVVVSCTLAVFAAAAVLQRARSNYRDRRGTPSRSNTDRFIDFLAASVAGLSMIAVLWTAFAAGVSHTCGP